MPNLTEKDMYCIEKLLTEEKRLISKYKDYASATDDATIRTVLEQSAAQHKNFYETVFSVLG